MTSEAFRKMMEDSRSGLNFRRTQLGFLELFDSGAIQKLFEVIRSYVAVPPEEHMKQYDSLNIDLETRQAIYEDECVYGAELRELAAEAIILALFKKIEINVKRAINIAFPGERTDKLFKAEEFEKFLKRNGIDVTQLSKYDEVSELRELNNCIKHSSIVSERLAKFGHWTAGERLMNLDSHFLRLAQASEFFVRALIQRLQKSLK